MREKATSRGAGKEALADRERRIMIIVGLMYKFETKLESLKLG